MGERILVVYASYALMHTQLVHPYDGLPFHLLLKRDTVESASKEEPQELMGAILVAAVARAPSYMPIYGRRGCFFVLAIQTDGVVPLN